MKYFLIILLASFALSDAHAKALESKNCFTYKKEGKLESSGECKTRNPPQSTFKIAISLMGFNEGILTDENHPLVPFRDETNESREVCRHPQTPATWMKNSCVWFSQVVTKKSGLKTFKSYVSKFDFGNHDVNGTVRKPDGLSDSWITSSLKISPEEQVLFLEKMLNSKLAVSESALKYTKSLLFQEDLEKGWKLFGKTGTGDLLDKKGKNDKTQERGWFVGWAEKGNEKIIFAQYVEIKNVKNKENDFSYVASKEARKMALEKVKQLIF